jgi:uncharacterized DUF497 family protein
MPVAKNPPQKGYRKPHWVPVTFVLRKDHTTGISTRAATAKEMEGNE